METQQKKSRRRRRRPVSPGIPGDYFECNETMLVKKLNALRTRAGADIQDPMVVPPLLESLVSSSLRSIDDDPQLFFADYNESRKTHGHEFSSDDSIERIDGEQLSVHSHKSTATVESEPESKSWQGSEIVLNATSFSSSTDDQASQDMLQAIADFDSEQSPRTVIKSIATFPLKHRAYEDMSTFTPGTASISAFSMHSGEGSHTEVHVLTKEFRNSLPAINDDDKDSSDRSGSDLSPRSLSSKRSQDYDNLQDQELFLKLSEEEDRRDFTHINNFSTDGDYLFQRLLRERTRIHMKREMLSTPDRELYIAAHKPQRLRREQKRIEVQETQSAPGTEAQGVYKPLHVSSRESHVYFMI